MKGRDLLGVRAQLALHRGDINAWLLVGLFLSVDVGSQLHKITLDLRKARSLVVDAAVMRVVTREVEVVLIVVAVTL